MMDSLSFLKPPIFKVPLANIWHAPVERDRLRTETRKTVEKLMAARDATRL
jgi:hypothetical protein